MPLPNRYFILQKSCTYLDYKSVTCMQFSGQLTDFSLLSFLGVFVLVGMTTLLPWNFFISLTNFWDYKFRNVSETLKTNGSTAKTDLQKEFTSYLSISSTVPNATFVIINALGTIHILRKDVYSTKLNLTIQLIFHKNKRISFLQVNIFQQHLFLHQLTHNMTKYCSLITELST